MEACIYLEDGETKLNGVNIFDVKCEPLSRVIFAPIETGVKSPDCKVRDPVKVTVMLTIVNGETTDREQTSPQETLRQIDRMFIDQDLNLYSVCDGVSIYRNLILQGCPHNRNAKEFDFLNYQLIFVEAMQVQGEGQKKPSNNENSDFRTFGFNPAEAFDFGQKPRFANYA